MWGGLVCFFFLCLCAFIGKGAVCLITMRGYIDVLEKIHLENKSFINPVCSNLTQFLVGLHTA